MGAIAKSLVTLATSDANYGALGAGVSLLLDVAAVLSVTQFYGRALGVIIRG